MLWGSDENYEKRKKEIGFGNMVNSVTKTKKTEGEICNQKAGVIILPKKNPFSKDGYINYNRGIENTVKIQVKEGTSVTH